MRRHWAAVMLAGSLPLWAENPLPEVIDFNRDIRPIFADTCYTCHGPDNNQRKAKLRLDQRDGLFRDVKGVRPVVAGDLVESELFARITSDDPDEQMPPPDSQRKLSAHQIALIKKWIEQGAKW
ncbi:MAG: c-type cytochrome domain-containing protein, partial [Verrucomicrobiota bacterium]|nr:c-type cytochrome domain-containing protein [Verrucomicrobiota bacterium]